VLGGSAADDGVHGADGAERAPLTEHAERAEYAKHTFRAEHSVGSGGAE
jgi:hypothetical protein